MHPTAFLGLARRLIDHEQSPEGHRSATSRAYYAALHTAADFLGELGISVAKGPEKHKDVVRHLEHSGDQEIEGAASMLDDLRADRNQADYDLREKTPEKKDNAELHFQEASEIIAAIVKCLELKRKGAQGDSASQAAFDAIQQAIFRRNRQLRGLPGLPGP